MVRQFGVADLAEGDVIVKREWGGEAVLVVVDCVEADIKNGRPGFDGEFVRRSADGRFQRTGRRSWGYMDQVESIVQKAVAK